MTLTTEHTNQPTTATATVRPKRKRVSEEEAAAEFDLAFLACGKTWRALSAEIGCSLSTIAKARAGRLPKGYWTRKALCRAVGLVIP